MATGQRPPLYSQADHSLEDLDDQPLPSPTFDQFMQICFNLDWSPLSSNPFRSFIKLCFESGATSQSYEQLVEVHLYDLQIFKDLI